MKIDFLLNGKIVCADVAPESRLLDVIRDYFGLTGTKEGCGVGECGACSVLMDDRLVNSCLIPAEQVRGHKIITIEGIGEGDGHLSDLQQAFIDCGAVQCGFCSPGMILAGEALLKENPMPTRDEIKKAIAGNLCRCTGYQQIIDAIEVTASKRLHLSQN